MPATDTDLACALVFGHRLFSFLLVLSLNLKALSFRYTLLYSKKIKQSANFFPY
tara:strand:+ start:178 stop:339 length:162 start_codon:yes stop_codon:yes gene_type:complete